jgi:hypothetical protein
MWSRSSDSAYALYALYAQASSFIMNKHFIPFKDRVTLLRTDGADIAVRVLLHLHAD